MREANHGKLIELEALRGVAAVIVMLHHFLVVVAPRLHGRNFPDDPIALVRTPLFALVNGNAAVSTFFVLSGFVLTLRAMEHRDWRQIATGALKRWPRLVPLVVTTNILSAVFLLLGLYPGPQLVRHGASSNPDTPVIRSALIDGLFTTFFVGSARFNTALWTMHYELFGSFAAYATALILIFQKSFARAMLTGAIIMVAIAALADEGGIYYATMVSGVLVARIYIERDNLTPALAFLYPWRVPVVLATAALAIVLCGYEGHSKPTGFLCLHGELCFAADRSPVCTASPRSPFSLSFCFAIRSEGALPADRARRCWDGCRSRSYLVHLPILLGLVSPLYSSPLARLDNFVAALLAFVLFVALTLAAAYPLARFDERRVRKLREMTSLVVTSVRAA